MSASDATGRLVASTLPNENAYPAIAPLTGRLVALRTKAEIDASFKAIDAYVVEIPKKSANTVLINIDEALRLRDTVNLQHLRRFVNSDNLPPYLAAADQTDTRLTDQNAAKDTDPKQRKDTLYFLVCAASALSVEDISTRLSSCCQLSPLLHTIKVPLLPPISAEQAEKWSWDYWPTVYKNTNPFGPHPSIVARAETQIRQEAGYFMGLARSAGAATASALKGRNIGAVVVDRDNPQNSKVIALAGDARWNMVSVSTESDSGNVMAHAAMRVIGLVARKRQKRSDSPSRGVSGDASPTAFADEPLTELERSVYEGTTLKSGGYLCLELEIYLTHEPCVMCSMAILHSRFGRVIFEERMPKTGGLSAEQEKTDPEAQTSAMGYGLFWRPELNWKLLAWQWLSDEKLYPTTAAPDVHA
ncbi:MAG: hypothetical protein Q9195_003368 [Heterodermia aff. obscurata]